MRRARVAWPHLVRGLRSISHQGATAEAPAGAERIGAGIGRISNLVLDRGEGSWLYTTDGEKYLDFSTGIGVTNLGHCHPRVTEAVREQLGKLWHAQVNIAFHGPMLELTKKLEKVMPKGLDSFLFVTTGSEAVEAAVKLARHATKKPNVIVFQGGYHGRTLLTMSMTSSGTKYRAGYGPHASGVFVAPHPFFALHSVPSQPDHAQWAVEQLEIMLQQQTAASETAAVVLEPVLGEGGYVPPAPGLLQGIRDFCDRHNLLFIADEVQSGFGRTGRMFAVDHSNVSPDILVFAKGVASGFPLAGIASRRALTAAQPPGESRRDLCGKCNSLCCSKCHVGCDDGTQLHGNSGCPGGALEKRFGRFTSTVSRSHSGGAWTWSDDWPGISPGAKRLRAADGQGMPSAWTYPPSNRDLRDSSNHSTTNRQQRGM